MSALARMSAARGPDERGHPTRVTSLTVVVPACNEQDALPGTLKHLDGAVVALAAIRPDVVVRRLVVLDGCTDRSAEVARAHGCDTLPVTVRNVGAARRAGVDWALAQHGTEDPRSLWIACTDADTHVPRNWLDEQVRCATAGIDVLVGTVVPDGRLDPGRMRAWLQRHDLREGHHHVHGANLGFRASAYLAVGGFAAIGAHEDVDLVERLRRQQGVVVSSTDRHRVVTSSRLRGRAPAGFSRYLKALPTQDSLCEDDAAGQAGP
ncbi:glycosyl transferase family 2 [Luteococcus japonicus]|uniref:4,4'-diaponeurosporenoate glycosyltransferase n=2 Tax=Luteococcus japonicus TaxID=33984 RepID=A0A3N1ZPW8_9ACTN|nr:glycosyl transferase family 2 [Luteococcus japonicus]